jgi:hypothetical protein
MRGSTAFPMRVRTESPRRGTASSKLRSCAIAISLADTSGGASTFWLSLPSAEH